ncbi:putative sugar ABC transporter permease protein [Actinoplanes missouriensis 431]|uniref:Putative sugar ABC transporter permease protein n=1 Tax=Actinoplanes missouriensis (strain ATCC 14538 / DSM 43046 / CBS 188.64 / JCM 3121 / NBRC 102363 / NCIMB 12654 / NRRL B-3342 / UNCC 431) TaxID=512565 RepID=I0HI67_ACTM4|nr:ABC transporter permease [Actinoplanes missouriensis]BAL92704.1 putative sugar ABC transporter permease protein [Actinoplanes missouriensis 431]
MTTEAPAKKEESFLSHFTRNLWSSNTVTVTFLSIVLAFVIGAILIVVSDSEVLAKFAYFTARPGDALTASWQLISTAYSDLLKGAFGDPEAFSAWFSGTGTWQDAFAPISETLTYAAPLVFTGLSVALAFRGGLFNIGAQGQAVIGCITAGVAGFTFGLPIVLNLVVAIVAGAIGGALWGFIPGILKARTGAHEVITTIMLNYTAALFLSWLVLQKGVQDPDRTDAISKTIADSAQLPSFGGVLRVHLGILLAVAVTAGVAWLLNRSSFGFELRAVGANQHAAKTAGISVAKTYAVLMAVAGALAGLGGATQVLGTAHALTPAVAGNIGFDGLLVALLGRNKPWGTLWAALLFGALRAGGNRMQSYSGISLELVTVLQALIVIFIAAPALVKAIFRLRATRLVRPGASLAKG